MPSPATPLPNTLVECQAMIQKMALNDARGQSQYDELEATCEATLEINVEYLATIERQQKTNEELQTLLESLKRDLALLKRSMFGQRRERFDDPRQSLLFASAELGGSSSSDVGLISEPETDAGPEDNSDETPRRNRRGRVRRVIPECLPREKRVNKLDEQDLPEELRDQPARRFEKKVGEWIEWHPPKLVVIEEYVETIAIDNHDATQTTMRSASPAPRLLSGLAGDSLLAGIATWRFADHLPYYRLEEILQRSHLEIDRATQCRWMGQVADRMRPLVDWMRVLTLRSSVVQADETFIKLLVPGQGHASTAYLWAILGDRDHPYTTFSFTEDRSRAGPDEFFKNFSGTLVSDAYSCYESLSARSQETIVLAGCHVHARRKFEELHQLAATELTSTAMGYFQRLFAIEDELLTLSDEVRLQQRQQRARPLMEQFKRWLDATLLTLRPKHELRGAINYMTSRWESFTRFLTSGAIPIHNNASEQAVKLAVIGKKNWLFFGSPSGGRTAAVLYTLTATCRRLQIDPEAYLTDVFGRIGSCDPANPESMNELLPDRWLAAHPSARVQIRVDESKAKADRKRRHRAQRQKALQRAQRKKR